MEERNINGENTRHALCAEGNYSANHADLVQEIERLKAACAAARSEGVMYSRIAHALAQGCIDLFYVNTDTGEYVEFCTDDEQSTLTKRRQAADFFESCKREAKLFVHEEDQAAFVAIMNREFLSETLDRSRVFEMTYRRMRDDGPIFVNMRISRMEDDERFIVIAVTDVDELVRKRLAEERMQKEQLERMRSQANIDALTGVRNRHAFLEVEAHIDRQIAGEVAPPFAIVVLDVNNLKIVNDTAGHHAGDELLRDACKVICDTFKHSPVFRIGGDEFAVIAQGEDCEHLEERLTAMRDHNARAMQGGGAVIACGAAFFQGETHLASVFDRADRNMYEDKFRLKSYDG